MLYYGITEGEFRSEFNSFYDVDFLCILHNDNLRHFVKSALKCSCALNKYSIQVFLSYTGQTE